MEAVVVWVYISLTSLWRKVKESGNKIAQLCPTLCDPMDCSLLGSPIHGIFWARVLEWVAISFSIWRKGKCISQSSPRKTEQVEHTHTHTHTHLFVYSVMHGIGLYRLRSLARPMDSAVYHEISSFSGKPQLFSWGLSTAWIWCTQIIEHNLLSQQIVGINHLYKISSPWHLD